MVVSVSASAAFFIGTVLGAALSHDGHAPPAPEPSPQVTIWRDVPVVREVQIPAKLPQSCIDLPQFVSDLTSGLNDLDTSAGKLKDEAADIQTYSMTGNSAGMVAGLEAMAKTVEALDVATVAKADYAQKFRLALERCQSDLD